MKKAVIILGIAFLVGACGTPWRCTCTSSVERVVETVDSVAYRSEEVRVSIPEECASESVALGDTSRVQTSVAEATAWVEDGRIHQRLSNRSEEMLRITLDIPVYIHSEKEYLTRTVVREAEKRPGRIRQAVAYAGIVALTAVAAALLTAVRFIRIKTRLKDN